MWKESRYNQKVIGYKLKHLGNGKFGYALNKHGKKIPTAVGLMQVQKNAVEEVGGTFEKAKTDALSNLKAGTAYFGKYYDIFKGDIDRTLGAYNAGPGRAFKKTHTKYVETRKYIEQVNKKFKELNN